MQEALPTEMLLEGRTYDCESRSMRQQSSDQLLLKTRLTIPPVRSDLVARPRLVRSLEACMEHPLTLLAAPAGFGKTVVLSSWARQQQPSVSWVSLDSSDNDTTQFWTYLLAALDRLSPGLGAKPLSLLQSAQPAPIETVLVALINAISALRRQPSHVGKYARSLACAARGAEHLHVSYLPDQRASTLGTRRST